MAKPTLYGLFPCTGGDEPVAGWTIVQRDDTAGLFEDDFEACVELVKAYAELKQTSQPDIMLFAPAVGWGQLSSTGGDNEIFDYIDKLPEVRESCPSWVYLVPTFVVEAFDYAEGE